MASPTLSAARAQVRGFWAYYWVYARTRAGVHGAATAGLTAFGLLMYFNRWFVVPAIAVYLLPPVYLYLTGDTPERTQTTTHDTDAAADGDTDMDVDGTDTDTDTDGFDADADADGVDADADADGVDADADADGTDTDTDTNG